VTDGWVTVFGVRSSDVEPHREAGRWFADQGYAVLEGFLDLGVVGKVRCEVDAALQAPLVSVCERPHNLLALLRWNEPIVDLVVADAGRRRPLDIRAHLIQHLAQPRDDEQPRSSAWTAGLLPNFAGVPVDLKLNRAVPADFAVER
jgi:hypothetical protein